MQLQVIKKKKKELQGFILRKETTSNIQPAKQWFAFNELKIFFNITGMN